MWSRSFAALSLCVSVSVLSACSSEPEAADKPPRPVVTERALSYSGDARGSYTGRLRNAEVSQIGFEVTGTVTRMLVDLGDRFERGDVLAELDARQYDLEIERRRGAIRQAEADLADAEVDYERKRGLEGTGAIAGSVIDAALARRDAALSNLDSLNASLGQAQKDRRDAVLRADFDGRVVRRLVEPGQTMAGGAGVLEVAADDASLEAVFNISETDLSEIELDQIYPVTVTAIGATYDGRVVEISDTGSSSLSFPVVLDIPSDGGARAGMGAVLSLAREDVPQASLDLVVLPATAVQTRPDGSSYVVTVAGDGTARFRNVETDRLTDEGWLLRSGVRPGESIVSRGAVQLREGQAVSPIDQTQRRFPE